MWHTAVSADCNIGATSANIGVKSQPPTGPLRRVVDAAQRVDVTDEGKVDAMPWTGRPNRRRSSRGAGVEGQTGVGLTGLC